MGNNSSASDSEQPGKPKKKTKTSFRVQRAPSTKSTTSKGVTRGPSTRSTTSGRVVAEETTRRIPSLGDSGEHSNRSSYSGEPSLWPLSSSVGAIRERSARSTSSLGAIGEPSTRPDSSLPLIGKQSARSTSSLEVIGAGNSRSAASLGVIGEHSTRSTTCLEVIREQSVGISAYLGVEGEKSTKSETTDELAIKESRNKHRVCNSSEESINRTRKSTDQSDNEDDNKSLTAQSGNKDEIGPLIDQSENRSETMSLKDELSNKSENESETSSLTDQLEKKAETASINDQPEKQTDAFSLTDHIENMPATLINQSLIDQSVNTPQAVSLTDQSENTPESLSLTDQSENTTQALSTDQSENIPEIVLLTNRSDITPEVVSLNDQSENVSFTGQTESALQAVSLNEKSEIEAETMSSADHCVSTMQDDERISMSGEVSSAAIVTKQDRNAAEYGEHKADVDKEPSQTTVVSSEAELQDIHEITNVIQPVATEQHKKKKRKKVTMTESNANTTKEHDASSQATKEERTHESQERKEGKNTKKHKKKKKKIQVEVIQPTFETNELLESEVEKKLKGEIDRTNESQNHGTTANLHYQDIAPDEKDRDMPDGMPEHPQNMTIGKQDLDMANDKQYQEHENKQDQDEPTHKEEDAKCPDKIDNHGYIDDNLNAENSTCSQPNQFMENINYQKKDDEDACHLNVAIKTTSFHEAQGLLETVSRCLAGRHRLNKRLHKLMTAPLTFDCYLTLFYVWDKDKYYLDQARPHMVSRGQELLIQHAKSDVEQSASEQDDCSLGPCELSLVYSTLGFMASWVQPSLALQCYTVSSTLDKTNMAAWLGKALVFRPMGRSCEQELLQCVNRNHLAQALLAQELVRKQEMNTTVYNLIEQIISTNDLSKRELGTHDLNTRDVSTNDTITHDLIAYNLGTHEHVTHDLETASSRYVLDLCTSAAITLLRRDPQKKPFLNLTYGLIRESYRLNPDPTSTYRLALVFMSEGQPDEAIQVLEKQGTGLLVQIDLLKTGRIQTERETE